MRVLAVPALFVCLLGCGGEGATASAERPAASSSTSVPEESWSDTGITATRSPQRVLIRKTGWRGGPEALILEATEKDVARFHQLLAGNQRLYWTCGFHWSIDFEYDLGVVESIEINEQCETFRRHGDEIRRIQQTWFKRASDRPSHYLMRIEARPGSKAALERELEARVGLAFNIDPAGKTVLLAHPQPWSPERIAEIRRFSTDVAVAAPLESYDTGN